MASVTKYAGIVTATTGVDYASWYDLTDMLVESEYAFASMSSFDPKAQVTLTNFGFNLPEGAEPTKITVEYVQYKNTSVGLSSPQIDILHK